MSRYLLTLVLLAGCASPAATLSPATMSSAEAMATAMIRESMAETQATVALTGEPELQLLSAWQNPWTATHKMTTAAIITLPDGSTQAQNWSIWLLDGQPVHIERTDSEIQKAEVPTEGTPAARPAMKA